MLLNDPEFMAILKKLLFSLFEPLWYDGNLEVSAMGGCCVDKLPCCTGADPSPGRAIRLRYRGRRRGGTLAHPHPHFQPPLFASPKTLCLSLSAGTEAFLADGDRRPQDRWPSVAETAAGPSVRVRRLGRPKFHNASGMAWAWHGSPWAAEFCRRNPRRGTRRGALRVCRLGRLKPLCRGGVPLYIFIRATITASSSKLNPPHPKTALRRGRSLRRATGGTRNRVLRWRRGMYESV